MTYHLMITEDDDVLSTLGRPDGWRSTIIYGVAHFGKSLFWYASELLFAYFLTEVTGLNGLNMGAVLAIGLAFSATLDPIVGHSLARTLSSAKRAIQLQGIGSILSAVSLIVLFMGAWIPIAYRFPYAIVAGMLFRFSYALYDLPQNALISLATTDAAARTRVTSTRLVFSGLAALAIAAAIAPLTLAHAAAGGARLPLVELGFALSLGAVASAGLLCGTVGRSMGPVEIEPAVVRWTRSVPAGCRLPLILAFVMSISIPLFGKLQPYLTAYGLNSAFWGGIIGCAVPIGSLASQPIWSALSRERSRRHIVSLSSIATALGGLIFWIAAPSHAAIATGGALLVGGGSGGLALGIWAAFGDAIAVAPGREGWSFGLLTASFKLGLAIGGLALGAFLDSVDYRAHDGIVLSVAMAVGVTVGAVACLALTALDRERDAGNAAWR